MPLLQHVSEACPQHEGGNQSTSFALKYGQQTYAALIPYPQL